MDVNLRQEGPHVTLDARSASLRDVTIIEGKDDFFDAYTEEARLTSGIEISLIMDSEVTQESADSVPPSLSDGMIEAIREGL
jgi:hypothetical protein